ncbi:hypothetical protein [Microbacterium sp. CJ88]|uniref:hypothetical protein n=1 Tax=Microbacterium sp. CJ88 TaxID=3445672 RepID=UPI003F657D27
MDPTVDDRRELALLQLRAYGPSGGDPLSPSEAVRLEELEAAARRRRFPLALDAAGREERLPSAASAEPPPLHPAALTAPEEPVRPPVRRWWVRAAAAGGVAAAAAIAVVVSVAVGAGAGGPPEAEASAASFPEFATAQTGADELPADGVAALVPAIAPETTRFLGRLDGVDLYLARTRDYPGVCVISRDETADAALSAGCGGAVGPDGGGLLRGVTGRLSVTVGPFAGPPPLGDPIALSESVTAFRRVLPPQPTGPPSARPTP